MLLNTYSLLPQDNEYHTQTVALAIAESRHRQWVEKQERKEKRKAFFKRMFNPAKAERKMEI